MIIFWRNFLKFTRGHAFRPPRIIVPSPLVRDQFLHKSLSYIFHHHLAFSHCHPVYLLIAQLSNVLASPLRDCNLTLTSMDSALLTSYLPRLCNCNAATALHCFSQLVILNHNRIEAAFLQMIFCNPFKIYRTSH